MYKSAAGLLEAGCIPGCVCVTAEGCPCCDSIVETTEAYAQTMAGCGATRTDPPPAWLEPRTQQRKR